MRQRMVSEDIILKVGLVKEVLATTDALRESTNGGWKVKNLVKKYIP